MDPKNTGWPNIQMSQLGNLIVEGVPRFRDFGIRELDKVIIFFDENTFISFSSNDCTQAIAKLPEFLQPLNTSLK